jgi:hypothetical protein
MAITYKVLGQINPAAATLTNVYVVPAVTQTVISTVSVCNQTNVAASFSLAVQPGGATIAPKHYINYNTPLGASDTITLTLGITLGATDVLSANVSTANISINAFGSEIT